MQANVSLSGYEEPVLDDDETENDTTATVDTPDGRDEHTATGTDAVEEDEDFTVDSPTQVTGVRSTPDLATSTSMKASGAGRRGGKAATLRSPSPRKYTGRNPLAMEASSEEPSTPRLQTELFQQSSPFQPPSA